MPRLLKTRPPGRGRLLPALALQAQQAAPAAPAQPPASKAAAPRQGEQTVNHD